MATAAWNGSKELIVELWSPFPVLAWYTVQSLRLGRLWQAVKMAVWVIYGIGWNIAGWSLCIILMFPLMLLFLAFLVLLLMVPERFSILHKSLHASVMYLFKIGVIFYIGLLGSIGILMKCVKCWLFTK
jgi:hypothetical protein